MRPDNEKQFSDLYSYKVKISSFPCREVLQISVEIFLTWKAISKLSGFTDEAALIPSFIPKQQAVNGYF